MASYSYSFEKATDGLLHVCGNWPIKVLYDEIDKINTYGLFETKVEEDGTIFIPAFGACHRKISDIGYLYPIEDYRKRICIQVASVETMFKQAMLDSLMATFECKDNMYRAKRGIILSKYGIPYLVGGARYHIEYPDYLLYYEIIINAKCLLDSDDQVVKFILKRLIPFFKQDSRRYYSKVNIVCKELDNMIIHPRVPTNPAEDTNDAAKFLLNNSGLWENKVFNSDVG